MSHCYNILCNISKKGTQGYYVIYIYIYIHTYIYIQGPNLKPKIAFQKI